MIVILCGPSGVGKDTVARALCEHEDFVASKSWTTRPRRPSDDDDSYAFVDRAAFLAHAANGGFVEHAEYHGELYGTPTPDVDEKRHLVLVLEPQGARALREQFPNDTLIIQIHPPSVSELERRMRFRGDDDDLIRQRLDSSFTELFDGAKIADGVVTNTNLADAVTACREAVGAAANRQETTVADRCFDANLRVERIVHLGCMATGDAVERELMEFLTNDAEAQLAAALDVDVAALRAHLVEETADAYEQLQIAIARRAADWWIVEAAHPEYTVRASGGRSFSWGYYQTKCFAAPTFAGALDRALAWAEADLGIAVPETVGATS